VHLIDGVTVHTHTHTDTQSDENTAESQEVMSKMQNFRCDLCPEEEMCKVELLTFCVTETKEDVVAKIAPLSSLSDMRLSVIRHNMKSLCELIPSNDRFTESLYNKKCLTDTQMNEILSEQTVTDRNTRLLDIMTHINITDYDKIVDEVDGSELHYLANLLRNGGG